MSEKRYIIVSASHHNKPRALFLSEPFKGKTKPTWRYYLDNALLFTLKQAKKAAGETPIGCYIIEHNEDLTVWFHKGEGCKFSDFIEIAADSKHEVIGDLPQSMQPQPEAESEPNFLPFAENAECIKIALNRLNTESEPQPSPAPEAKKRVAHVLYSIGKIGEHKVYAHYKSDGIFVRVGGIIADAYRTPDDAQFAADVLNNNGDTNFGWQVEQIEF